jgi:hypothetical protein
MQESTGRRGDEWLATSERLAGKARNEPCEARVFDDRFGCVVSKPGA